MTLSITAKRVTSTPYEVVSISNHGLFRTWASQLLRKVSKQFARPRDAWDTHTITAECSREFCAPSSRTTHIRNERGKLTMVLYRCFCVVASSRERQPFPSSQSCCSSSLESAAFFSFVESFRWFPHRDVPGGGLGPLSSGTAGRPNWAAIFFAIRPPSEIFVQCSVAIFYERPWPR
jgi:hypothetical protein